MSVASERFAGIVARLDRTGVSSDRWPDAKGEYWALCPFHPDTHPTNFSVHPERGYRCFACDAHGGLKALAEKLGIQTEEELFPLTLEAYARAKKLPEAFLTELGLETVYIRKRASVKLPYYDESGTEVAVRFRLSLAGDARFRWRTGSKVHPYGLWLLRKTAERGYIIVVEGESDSQTLWHHGIPAIGAPGATTWKADWSEFLAGREVYVWQEPGEAGERMVGMVGASIPECQVITAPAGRKDISAAHLAGEDIPALVKRLRTEARPFKQIQGEQLAGEAAEARKAAGDLLECPDILDRFIGVARRTGLVGEEINAKLLYLGLTSRMLDRPVNFYVKGSSSGGKSFAVERVLDLFPPSAFYCLTSMSERALAYSEEPLSHRFLVVFEYGGLNSDFATYLLRSLLSEGHIRYETVEKTDEGLRPRLIERDGPTGLILTTTATRIHAENETRGFSITVDDSAEQTRQVLADLADRRNGQHPQGVDLAPWHGLQRWLELAGAREVTIPYAREIAAGADPRSVRLRRDFTAVLNLIAAHALLHQIGRKRDAQGRVIAELADYRAVHDLVIDTLNEGVRATVSPQVRETVEVAVRLYARLHDCVIAEGVSLPHPPPYLTVPMIARELDLESSTAWRRVKQALDADFLVNDEVKKRRPAKLHPGEPLPAETSVLPSPDQLEGGGGPLTPPAHTQSRNLKDEPCNLKDGVLV